MKYLCTIILLAGLFMGQAWGGDDPFLYSPDPNDFSFLPINDDEMLVFSDPGPDWSLEWSVEAPEFWDLEYVKENGERFKMSEIRAILERCRDALVGIPLDGSPSEGMIAYSDASGDLFWTYPENIALRRDIDEMIGRME